MTNPAPSWLDSWTKTRDVITTTDPNGNVLTLEIYQKNVNSGEEVILGTNGGNGNSVNYIVLAREGYSYLKGDVNLDGSVTSVDAVMLQEWLLGKISLTSQQGAQADVIEDNYLDSLDMAALRQLIIS
jgi:Fe-S cluster assembly ATPase SufC